MAFNILIVDDDPVFRAIVSELLSPWFTCVEADDGDTALAYLDSAEVALVVTDILMPRLDGFELIRAVRARRPGVPIIAVSGGSAGLEADMLLETASSMGVDAVTTKPLQPSPFLALVNRVLETARR